MKIERTKNAARNIVFGTALKLYQIFIPFLMRTAMIYFMGVQYLGLNSLFTSVLQVLNLAELGVGSAMVFSMYKPIVDDDSKTICALMHLYRTYYNVIGVIIAVVGIVVTPFIPHLIKSDLPPELNVYVLYLLNLAATVLSYWLFAYKNALFQAHQRNDITSKITLITSTIQYAVQLAVIVWIKDYYLYVIAALATQAITNIVTALAANKIYPDYHPKGKLDKIVVRDINHRIRDLFTSKLGAVIVNSADTVVISAFLGLTVLAVYQNYYFIMNSICGFIGVIFASVTAGIGNSLATENIEKNYRDFKIFSFLICFVLCICCNCFIALYQPFMEMWVGKDLMLPFIFVILFCILFYLLELAMVWATIKDAAGLWHSDRFRPLIGALVNLVLNIFLVQSIGLYGIILSTVLSYLFVSMPWLIHNLFSLLYKKSLRGYLKKIILYVFVCILSCFVTYYLCSLIVVNGLIKLIIYGAIALATSLIIQVIFYYKLDEYKNSARLIKSILRR